jgi:hypothetical protein
MTGCAIFEETVDQQFTLKKAQQEARKKVYVSAHRLAPASSAVGAPPRELALVTRPVRK